MKIKNQKGAISVFVLLAMLFFLVFIMSSYAITARKVQTQTMTLSQLQYYYKRDPATIASTKYSSTSIVPIYNYEQLKLAGTDTYDVVDNKVHFFKSSGEYQLKTNIVIDFNSYFSSPLNKTGNEAYKNLTFDDFKVDAPASGEINYRVSSNGFNIYYYADGAYWKLVNYQNLNGTTGSFLFTSSTPTTSVKQQNRYSLMNTISGYQYDENKDGTPDYYEFLLIYNNGTSATTAFSKESFFRWTQKASPNDNRTAANEAGYHGGKNTEYLTGFKGLFRASDSKYLYSGNSSNDYTVGVVGSGKYLKSNGSNQHSKAYLFVRVDPR